MTAQTGSHLADIQADIRTRLDELLDALGNTRTEVARRLTAGGHLGTPSMPSECPIAEYLRRSDLPTGGGVVVLGPDVGIGITPIHWTYVTAPQAVQDFVFAFDTGAYGELVGGGTR